MPRRGTHGLVKPGRDFRVVVVGGGVGAGAVGGEKVGGICGRDIEGNVCARHRRQRRSRVVRVDSGGDGGGTMRPEEESGDAERLLVGLNHPAPAALSSSCPSSPLDLTVGGDVSVNLCAVERLSKDMFILASSPSVRITPGPHTPPRRRTSFGQLMSPWISRPGGASPSPRVIILKHPIAWRKNRCQAPVPTYINCP
jgi:hypothetical protein